MAMPTISEHDALPAGARLGEFEIRRVLGIGGFGIVYLAFDHALERDVAIKEYMPAALASRGFGSEVVVRSASHVDTFTLGMRSFINEARLLARFDHPSLVKVYRFWEQHGTAYMVMPYYQGRTLQEVRHAMNRPVDEAWLRRLITPLLGALECLHRANVYHRDVAPDNILLLDDERGPGCGPPVLLDLGAARRVIGDRTQTLTAIVKPSFAPIEQYAETVQLRQGPWTDLYALAAVVHFCITGRPPMPATARTLHDDVATLRDMCADLASDFDCHFSESFAHAIDHALAVRPQDRPESVAAWRAELDGIVQAPIPAPAGIDAAGSAEKVRSWLAEALRAAPLEGEGGGTHTPSTPYTADYMTTVPAAGRLSAAPTWPATPGSQPLQPRRTIEPAPEAAGTPSRMPPTMALEASLSAARAAPQATSDNVAVATPLRAAMASGEQAIPPTMPIARRPATQPSSSHAGIASASPLDDGRGGGGDAPLSLPQEPYVQTFILNKPGAAAAGAGGGDAVAARVPLAARPRAPAANTSWFRWTFSALMLLLAMAIWWSQPASKPVAIAEPELMPMVPAAGALQVATTQAATNAVEAPPPDDKPIKQASVTTATQAAATPLRKAEAGERSGAPAPLNPRRACGDRNFIMLAICMKRYCSRASYSGHGECVRMRQQESAQRDLYYP